MRTAMGIYTEIIKERKYKIHNIKELYNKDVYEKFISNMETYIFFVIWNDEEMYVIEPCSKVCNGILPITPNHIKMICPPVLYNKTLIALSDVNCIYDERYISYEISF